MEVTISYRQPIRLAIIGTPGVGKTKWLKRAVERHVFTDVKPVNNGYKYVPTTQPTSYDIDYLTSVGVIKFILTELPCVSGKLPELNMNIYDGCILMLHDDHSLDVARKYLMDLKSTDITDRLVLCYAQEEVYNQMADSISPLIYGQSGKSINQTRRYEYSNPLLKFARLIRSDPSIKEHEWYEQQYLK